DDGEGRALALFALQPDTPFVLVNDALDDCQAQARSLKFTGHVLGTVELVEDVGLIFFRNTDPGVTDSQDDQRAVGLDANADLAAGQRVFDGVADQIVHQLFQPELIAQDRWDVRRTIKGEYVTFGIELVRQPFDRLTCDLVQPGLLKVYIETGLDAAQFQQLGDQRRDRLDAGLDVFGKFVLLLVERPAALDQFHVAEDRGQGGAQVVRDCRHEFALGPVKLLQVRDVLHDGTATHALDDGQLCVEDFFAAVQRDLAVTAPPNQCLFGEQRQHFRMGDHLFKRLADEMSHRDVEGAAGGGVAEQHVVVCVHHDDPVFRIAQDGIQRIALLDRFGIQARVLDGGGGEVSQHGEYLHVVGVGHAWGKAVVHAQHTDDLVLGAQGHVDERLHQVLGLNLDQFFAAQNDGLPGANDLPGQAVRDGQTQRMDGFLVEVTGRAHIEIAGRLID